MRALRSLIAKDNPLSIAYAARTAGAAVFSLLVAHILRLPEPYWAGMTTLAVMQATPEAGLPAAAQYFAGPAGGAAVGGWAGDRFPGNPFVFGACALAMGVLFAQSGWNAARIVRRALRWRS